jgi:hypothetical protein
MQLFQNIKENKMDKVSTPDDAAIDAGGTGDDFDISAEDHSQDIVDDESADTSDVEDEISEDDNAPSDSDEDSADDKTNTEESDEVDKTPTFDKDLDKWAEDRGYGTLETDKERRMAQDARNSQRSFSKRSEAAAQAKKLADNIGETAKDEIADDADPLAKEVAELKQGLTTERQNRQISEYVLAMSTTKTPVTEEVSDAMGELLAQTAKTDGQAGVNFLIGNIGRWHKLAISELGVGDDSTDIDAVSDKVRKEERARIEKKQSAAGPTRSAKTNIPAKQISELEKIWNDDDI